jgi:RNA polymerase sigma-70 factor (ECF subfamily)
MEVSGEAREVAAVPKFATTHWSLVVAARDRDSFQAAEALAELCRVYWYPLYAFIRRQGYSWDKAQDLTQEFFARLLEKDVLELVDRTKGKFRSFLVAACVHFLANERDRARAIKRGGGRVFVPIDPQAAEGRYNREPADTMTAERLFERRWALTLLDQVLARLRREYEVGAKSRLFDAMKGFLLQVPDGDRRYRESAERLHMTEGAFKVAVHRLRQRYREMLREEIGRTVHDPEHIDEEIRSLFAALCPG